MDETDVTRAVAGARRAVAAWGALPEHAFECRQVTGGLTNHLMLVEVPGGVAPADCARPQALIRVFGRGTDGFIDRETEQHVSSHLSAAGIAPRVLGHFPGGRAEEFLHDAKSLRHRDLHAPAVLSELARLMARMHATAPPQQLLDASAAAAASSPGHEAAPPPPMTVRMCRSLLAAARQTAFPRDTDAARKLAVLHVPGLAAELTWLEGEIASACAARVLCHRDLQSGNVMATRDEHGALARACLIDFEYAGMDFCGFDFGNTFCEMAIDNFCSRFPGFVLDPDMYPSAAQQDAFFRAYLAEFRARGGPVAALRSSTADVSHEHEDERETLARLRGFGQLGSLASHLQWALWGAAQAQHGLGEGSAFGHLEYALARRDQYFALRRQLQ